MTWPLQIRWMECWSICWMAAMLAGRGEAGGRVLATRDRSTRGDTRTGHFDGLRKARVRGGLSRSSYESLSHTARLAPPCRGQSYCIASASVRASQRAVRTLPRAVCATRTQLARPAPCTGGPDRCAERCCDAPRPCHPHCTLRPRSAAQRSRPQPRMPTLRHWPASWRSARRRPCASRLSPSRACTRRRLTVR